MYTSEKDQALDIDEGVDLVGQHVKSYTFELQCLSWKMRIFNAITLNYTILLESQVVRKRLPVPWKDINFC